MQKQGKPPVRGHAVGEKRGGADWLERAQLLRTSAKRPPTGRAKKRFTVKGRHDPAAGGERLEVRDAGVKKTGSEQWNKHPERRRDKYGRRHRRVQRKNRLEE